MLKYFISRAVILIPFLFIISIISFAVIQLPPGSYVDSYVRRLELRGLHLDEQEIIKLNAQYGLDKTLPAQYAIWMKKILLHGNFGFSYTFNLPVTELIIERLPYTALISMLALVLQYCIAVPVGIYSALNKYTIGDYIFTFLGFIGLTMPSFLAALLLMYYTYVLTGWAITGLFSTEYVDAPWSLMRVFDMLKNIWLPVVAISIVGTASLIRIMRGALLDELRKQYVITARAKGLIERKVIFRYPFRIAINPLISTIGWLLPAIVGGEIIVSQVLNLKTMGTLLLEAIRMEDMYLAGAIVLILSGLTVIGTIISDILLASIDPRIRY